MRRALLLLTAIGATFLISVGAALAATTTSGDLLGPIGGGIDCRGNIFGTEGASPHGTVTVERTATQLLVTANLQGGDPNTTYSIEIFEATDNCGGDNAANTNVTLTTDAAGNGTATVTLPLPHPSLGGETIGDGTGSEELVVVLDFSLSIGAGDRFVAKVPISQDTQSQDTTKPTTTATPSVAPNAAGWNKEDVTVALNATDNEGGSGVKEITHSLNGGQSTTEQGDSVQVPVTAEGVNTIAFYATDNAGNSEDGKNLQVKIDKTPPAVSSTSPANNATGVSATAKVSATFSESGSGIDPATLTARTFKVAQVKPSGNVPVSGTISYDVSCKTVTFTPASNLAKGAYQATVTTGVEDKADNALANNYTWQFATAGSSKK